MEWVIDFCRDYGYWGMWLISFLSGTIFPFTSDVLLLFFLGMGLNPVALVIVSTIGNTMGGMTCFFMGRMAKGSWLSKYFRLSPEKAEKASVYIRKYGYWAAFFSFLAIVGEAIVILLGNMRVSWWKVLLVMTLGKLLRYAVLALSCEGVKMVI
ncbi:MAG: DedA family protein [Bacteroidaceae bacterium]|nr:DedA family protein [Bacteroidales bacterium]MBQ2877663.1 DedA family protein [Bacteroidaceae bacterium]MBQ3188629.1 DedA family protein [Bacteroidaceae bacterium]MBQ3622082.1 DedA family protein [Bacteroidaceae bacterium]